MTPFVFGDKIAVAVSGGGDSLCLCLLVHQWAQQNQKQLVALTVDHQLRAESGSESQQVAQWMQAQGIAHHILTWNGDKPITRLQERARIKRYELLRQWCQLNNISAILFAQHQDDQIETIVMRLSKGSTEDGLMGMKPLVEYPEVRVIRPFLTVTKKRLTTTLEALKQDWIEDPSNANMLFERVRLRQIIPHLSDHGISEESLLKFGSLMGCLSNVKNEYLDTFWSHVQWHPGGFALIPQNASPPVLQDFFWKRLIQRTGGLLYGPKQDALKRLVQKIALLKNGQGTTLGNCMILKKTDRLYCFREAPKHPDILKLTQTPQIWEGRFKINFTEPGTTIKRITHDDWKILVGSHPSLKEKSIPFPVIQSLPTLFKEGQIICIPFVYETDSTYENSITLI